MVLLNRLEIGAKTSDTPIHFGHIFVDWSVVLIQWRRKDRRSYVRR